MSVNWVDIKGFEGRYRISDLGQVVSLDVRGVDKRGNPYLRKGREKTLYVDNCGYLTVSLLGRARRIHRLLAQAFNPEFYDSCVVDHSDRNRLNNTLSNLRIASPRDNSRNANHRKGGTSVYHGVTRKSGQKYWLAAICTDVGTEYIGYYNTQGEAALAYNQAAILHHGEFASLNDLSGVEGLPEIPVRRKQNKPVICTTTNVVYESANAAARDLGLFPASVSQVCRGKAHRAGNYKFKFIMEDNNESN